MKGEDLKLIEGLRDDKGLQVDAARIRIEHTSIFYADDKIIRDAMSAEGKRQIADARRDGYLDIQERMDIERALDEAKVKPASEGPLTEEDRRKGRISELEFLDKWSPEKVQARIAKERKEVDVKAKAQAQANAPATMKALAAEYDSAYVEGTHLQASFEQAVLMDTSGADQDAVAAMLAKGYLTDAEIVQYAVQGVGTDEDALMEVFAGKTKAEIQAMAEEWAKDHPADPGDTRTPFERFRARIEEELSGREAFDILDMVDYGEPVTPREKADRAWRRVHFEASSTNGMASSEYQLVVDQATALDAEVAALEQHERMRPKPGDKDYTVDGLRKWQDDWEKKSERVQRQGEYADESVQMHREQVDFITDRLVMVLTAVVMAVVIIIGVVVSIFAPPVGMGFWAAFGAFMASTPVLVGTAVATAAVTMITKAAMKGSAYGWEEAATDAGMGAVDALASAATAGMGTKLLKLGFLARMAEEGGMMARVAAHGLAQGAEGLVQSVPSAFLGNVLNDENYKGGNALFNVLAGTAMQAAPGTVMAGAFGALGGISKPHVPPRTQDLLHFRGTPKERLTLFKKWKAENPAGNMKEFLREFDEGLLKQMSGDFDQKQLQRAMRKELLEHIPPTQRKAFANTPIEMLSEADFESVTGSKSAQAVATFRRGRPTILVKAGAGLSDLGEEGLHLLQRYDKATRDLVKALDETALRHWDKLPIEKQFELYRKKLLLEIDAQESLLASLEKKRGVTLDPEEAARRIRRSETTLENLRQRMKEVDAFTPVEMAEFGQGVRSKPQYLKEPPRLFAKKEPPVPPPTPEALEKKQLEMFPPAKPPAPEVPTPKQVEVELLPAKPPEVAVPEAKPRGGGKKRALVHTVTDTEPIVRQPGRPNDVWPNTILHADHPEVGPFSKGGPAADDPYILTAERRVFSDAERANTTLTLDPADTVAQIGPAWQEVKYRPKELRYYKLVEVTKANGETEFIELIQSKRSGNRWQPRGERATLAGEELEKKQSRAFTEALLGERLGPTEKFRRLAFKPRGEAQGSGIDEIIAEFDNAADPKSAKLHLIEVKGGEKAPRLKDVTAVGENLRKNLNELREQLNDVAWQRAHGLGIAHVEALGKAIEEWNISIELRLGPLTPEPPLKWYLVKRVEQIADTWRKLSLVHRVMPEGSAAQKELEALMDAFRTELKKGRVETTLKALADVEEKLQGTQLKPGLLAQYNIDPSQLKGLIHSLDPNVKPGELARVVAPFEAAKRVRTIGPTGNVLGWGDFDVTVSRSWRNRRFKPFELAQMRDLQAGLEAIPELDPASFSTLSLRDRQEALKKSVGAAMDALGIPKSRRPRVQFQNLPAGDYGWMEWNFNATPQGRLAPASRRGVIVINENLDVGDAVGTAVHESRHYYQAYQAYQYSVGRQSHPFSRRWWRNLPGSGGHYYGPGDPRYFRQPIETDAESFGRRVIDLLPPRWPPP